MSFAKVRPGSEGANGERYDFIEIGTCDWNTLTQYCVGPGPSASPLGNWLSNQERGPGGVLNARGLAVDPVQIYFESLPELELVTKLN